MKLDGIEWRQTCISIVVTTLDFYLEMLLTLVLFAIMVSRIIPKTKTELYTLKCKDKTMGKKERKECKNENWSCNQIRRMY